MDLPSLKNLEAQIRENCERVSEKCQYLASTTPTAIMSAKKENWELVVSRMKFTSSLIDELQELVQQTKIMAEVAENEL